MTGVSYPTPIQDVRKIENQNDLSINVFGYDSEDGVYPLCITKEIKDSHVNLLLITDEEKSHYCLIRNFSALMSHRLKDGHKQHFCFTVFMRSIGETRWKNTHHSTNVNTLSG